MELLTGDILRSFQNDIVYPLAVGNYINAAGAIPSVIDRMHANIPEKKRISYGIVHTIKTLGKALSDEINREGYDLLKTGDGLYRAGKEFKGRMVGLLLLSLYGLKDYKIIFPYFEEAAASSDWNEREICQMLFRKIIKKYPGECKIYLKKLSSSKNPSVRRFVAETLRPVVENRWIQEQPCYSCAILKSLFTEKNTYARTSVGNNLSDLYKKNPIFITEVVKQLVAMKDKNAYWIAYRACRNRVKTEPEKIMKLLKTREFRYKDRSYRQKPAAKKKSVKKSGRK